MVSQWWKLSVLFFPLFPKGQFFQVGLTNCQSHQNYFPELYKQKQQQKRFNSNSKVFTESFPERHRQISKDRGKAKRWQFLRLGLNEYRLLYLRSKWKNSTFNSNVRSKTNYTCRGEFFFNCFCLNLNLSSYIWNGFSYPVKHFMHWTHFV